MRVTGEIALKLAENMRLSLSLIRYLRGHAI